MRQAVEEGQLHVLVSDGAGWFATDACAWIPATRALLLSDFRQQGAKTGLHEMPIARERFADSLFLHYDKRYAVGERPILVGPGGVNSNPSR